ncbi:MAG: pantetheine-phosphate adenylyltransferase [Thaumarchaeota archaeon]|nr:pantetheine-phosphate adenylyltransferase [Nitrososphaerota archaeon]
MTKFDLIATGGTFDIIHKGHIELLKKAFEISSNVIIGLTSDELAEKKGKKITNDYSTRLSSLISVIEQKFPSSSFRISKLENDFGPAVLEEGVQAMIVSEETSFQGEILNKLRAEKNLPSIKIVVVPMVLAEDGKIISTTRIRNSEIDYEGNLLSIDK